MVKPSRILNLPGSRVSALQWILFTSFKYFTAGYKKKFRFASMSIIGIAVGLIAVIVIIGIMNGLQQGYLNDLIEIESYHARITVEPGTDSEKFHKFLKDTGYVQYSFEFMELEGVIRSSYVEPQPCLIKGLPAEVYDSDLGFKEELSVVSGNFAIDSLDQIVLGRNLAVNIGAGVNSLVELLVIGEGKTINFVPLKKQMSVMAKVGTGYPEIDSLLCFVNISLLKKMLPKTIPRIGIKLIDKDKIHAFIDEAEKFNGVIVVESWKEINKSLYSALMLEKYSMFIILFLVFLVVSINIKNSIERLVFSKKKDIGIMAAVGASEINLVAVFILQGIYIAFFGIVFGLVFGILAANNVNLILSSLGSVIKMLTGSSSIFFNYSFPVRIIPTELVFLSLGILILSLGASWIAVKKIMKFEPVRILHYE